jgi:alpha-tubulin suppressor-like RCC1 family protein
LTGAAGVGVGESFTCALVSGKLKCWGRNTYGTLGDGTKVDHGYPADVIFPSTGSSPVLTAFAAGQYHTCATIGGSYLDCWGINQLGNLGDGTLVDKASPTSVLSSSGAGILTGVTGVRASQLRTCSLMSNGGLKCWGGSPIGDGASTWRQLPVDVMVDATTPISNLTDVAMGSFHSCAVLSGGSLKCWGTNSVGQVGDGTTVTRVSPVDVGICP